MTSKDVYYTAVVTILCVTKMIAQGLPSAIQVTSGQKLVTSSLPFDKPFTIKYSFSDSVMVTGIALVKVPKAERRDYYSTIMTSRDSWSGDYTRPGEQEGNKRFSSAWSPGKGDSLDLLMYFNPLEPNKFYDVRILRNPRGRELDDYFELFKMFYYMNIVSPIDTISYKNDQGNAFKQRNDYPQFRDKLLKINKWKRPFTHFAFAGPDNGNLDIFNLFKFYKKYLASQYSTWAAATTDSAKKAARNNIIGTISSFVPPSGKEYDWPDFTVGESLRATTVNFDFNTRTNFTITPDFGYIYYGFQKQFYGIAPYLGAQIEFRYFDKSIPFYLIPNKTIWHRLSFSTGVTLSSLKKDKQREDFFSGKSLVAGFGFRLTSTVRITGGTVLFNRLDPNPLIDNKKLGVTPYVGVSIDLALKALLNDAAGIFGLNTTNIR